MKQAFQSIAKSIVVLVVGLGVLIPVARSSAAIVDWTMKGNITFYADVGLEPCTGLNEGDEFTIRFRYDTDQESAIENPTASIYEDTLSWGDLPLKN